MPRYVHFSHHNGPFWGRLEHTQIRVLSDAPWVAGVSEKEDVVDLDDVSLLPPAHPTKIVCVGRNYSAHAAELNNPVPEEPLLFLKPPSCLIGHDDSIVYPTGQTELVHHEGELALVIGSTTRHVSEEDALRRIFGYTLLNDVTARDLQRRDVQFTRGKGFDTFGPCGPWIDSDFTPGEQKLRVCVNGSLRQEGSLRDMIFSCANLVSRISRVMTLKPGDLVSTGTPSGVGPLIPGDRVEVSLEDLGTLVNHVEHAPDAR